MIRRTLPLFLAVAVFPLAEGACGPAVEATFEDAVDGSAADASTPPDPVDGTAPDDGGRSLADGAVDTGAPDGSTDGSADAGPVDAGPVDAGPVDAGPVCPAGDFTAGVLPTYAAARRASYGALLSEQVVNIVSGPFPVTRIRTHVEALTGNYSGTVTCNGVSGTSYSLRTIAFDPGGQPYQQTMRFTPVTGTYPSTVVAYRGPRYAAYVSSFTSIRGSGANCSVVPDSSPIFFDDLQTHRGIREANVPAGKQVAALTASGCDLAVDYTDGTTDLLAGFLQ